MKTFKGNIAIQLALDKGLITEDQVTQISIGNHKSITCPGWDLHQFMRDIGAGQGFLDEVINIQDRSEI